MKYIKIIARFLKWIVNKIPEVTQLGGSDILLAEIILRINREAIRKEFRPVQLSALKQIHTLKRGSSMEKMRERIETLRKHKEEVARGGHISIKKQEEFLPSVTPIRAVALPGYFIMFEGNGRVAALQEVLADARDITIDVEVFILPQDSSIFKDIHRLRKRYGFE